jgi:hypothetical protein
MTLADATSGGNVRDANRSTRALDVAEGSGDNGVDVAACEALDEKALEHLDVLLRSA